MYYFQIDPEKAQNVAYNVPDVPIQEGELQLSGFINKMVNPHWHKELEYVSVIDGSMTCQVNTSIFELHQNQGIIIHASQLHHMHSSQDCLFQSLLISPIFMAEHSKYIDAINIDAIPLDTAIPWEASVLKNIRKMYALSASCPPFYELQLKSAFYQMWADICHNLSEGSKKTKKYFSKADALKLMINFIQNNYHSPVSLDEIAHAGNVSKSVCCRLFDEFLNQTPFTYLMQYRVQKSLHYLMSSSLNITEIAAESGFSSSSYYAETFKKFYQCTPSEYRKDLQRSPLINA